MYISTHTPTKIVYCKKTEYKKTTLERTPTTRKAQFVDYAEIYVGKKILRHILQSFEASKCVLLLRDHFKKDE
jgi:hypothetical protein